MHKGLLTLAIAALLLTGCAATRVSNVLNDPSRFQGRNVKLTGEVTRSTGAVVAGLYEIDDGSGKINVFSTRPIPRKGARVTVQGRVQSGINVLGRTFGTVVQENNVKVHRD